jgi:asparaginyl-tRNA synthetase
MLLRACTRLRVAARSARASSATSVAHVLAKASVGSTFTVTGWVKSARVQKHTSFLQLNDGTSTANLQVLWPTQAAGGGEGGIPVALGQQLSAGCSVTVTGTLVTSPKPAQPVELAASRLILHGTADALRYPLLAKKEPSAEYLREVAHLRPRTTSGAAMLRVRHTLALAAHSFFDAQGYTYVQTPVLTGNDCEGAGELFAVRPAGEMAGSPPFFGGPAYLTVSGQLHLEAFALSLGRVYTFGPTFRAEKSNTPRHLAEFWMLEPELAPGGVADAMNLCEASVRAMTGAVLGARVAEVAHFSSAVDASIAPRLQQLADGPPYVRMSYSEAIKTLSAASVAWKTPVAWADGLASEHERWLAETAVGGPVFVVDYPAHLKPFYMRANEADDVQGPTVGAFDLLVPRIGELAGGSAREERFEVLAPAMAARGLLSPAVVASLASPGGGRDTGPADTSDGSLDWYLDGRKYGTMAHAGYGLGFERLVMFATGAENIRDAVPVPRVPGACRM